MTRCRSLEVCRWDSNTTLCLKKNIHDVFSIVGFRQCFLELQLKMSGMFFSESQCSWDSNNGTCFCCITACVVSAASVHHEYWWVSMSIDVNLSEWLCQQWWREYCLCHSDMTWTTLVWSCWEVYRQSSLMWRTWDDKRSTCHLLMACHSCVSYSVN